MQQLRTDRTVGLVHLPVKSQRERLTGRSVVVCSFIHSLAGRARHDDGPLLTDHMLRMSM